MDWWRELEFERWQRMNVKGSRFIKLYNLKMFAIPPCERDVFYQAVQDLWAECESFLALSILTLVVFSYMTDGTESGTGRERDLIQNIAEVEHHVLALGVLLHCARYDPIDCLAYPPMVNVCNSSCTLLSISLGSN